MQAHYSGDATYAPSTSPAISVTVNPEPSTIAVSVLTGDQNGNPIPFTNGPFGSFVYLRADVTGQSHQGFPTGTVSFSDTFGAVPGGSTFPLNSQGNAATPNGIYNFDTGTHTITASYTGDASFSPSNAAQSQAFTITPGFYAAIPTAQSTVLISAPGSSGQTSITVSTSTNFKGTISLACAGLPSEATCTFTPASITANGTLSTTAASITVTTTAATAMATPRRPAYLLAQWMMGLALPLSVVVAGCKQQRRRFLLLLTLMLVVLIIPSCGGGSGSSGGSKSPPPNAGTPAGSSNVVVTATSGSTVSTSSFVLVVQ